MTDAQEKQPKTPDPFFLPIKQAARSIRECVAPIADMPLQDIEDHLMTTSGDLEAALGTQARVLDSVFSRLVEHGAKNESFSPAVLNIALKAQNQFRSTVRALENIEIYRKKLYETDYWRDRFERQLNEFKE